MRAYHVAAKNNVELLLELRGLLELLDHQVAVLAELKLERVKALLRVFEC